MYWRCRCRGRGTNAGCLCQKTRFFVLFLATLTVAAAVSVTGLISFIGLLPHTARLLTGHNRRSSCLLSGIIGSVLLLTADVLAEVPDCGGIAL